MAALAVQPFCALCKVQDASQQVEVEPRELLAVCSQCAMPLRRALALGLTLAGVRAAEAAGALGTIAAEVRIDASEAAIAPVAADAQGASVLHSDALQPGAQIARHATLDPHVSTGMAGGAVSMGADAAARQMLVEARGLDARPFGVRRERAEHALDGRKQCNLCSEGFPLSGFPASGDRIKPYCNTCTPLVRRGIQVGFKVYRLRDAYQQGGHTQVQVLVDLISDPARD